MRRCQAILCLVAALFLPNLAKADVTGSIVGIIRDSSQAVVPNAVVRVTNIDTNFTKETSSGSDGEYRILALPAGRYTLVATASGFQDFTARDIVVSVNDVLRIEATLNVGATQQRVNVEANSVHVETESTQLGDVIETRKILSLPLNGRSYLDLLGLQAGVVPITSSIVPNDRPVSGFLSNPGNISVSGQRETANAFLVNGGDVSEGKDGGAGLVPNLDSVAEFRLITNSFDAEYGRFSGGVMNAITKSGANAIHGDVFEFFRNDKLDARGFFDPAKAELRRNQFGYAVGGPFWKNRLFWFTDYQGTRQVVGASTGIVQLPTTNARNGVFTPSTFGTKVVQGAAWAQTLSQRLGYTVTNGELYSSAGCANTAQCVFPGGVIPRRAFDTVAVNTLNYIPVGNLNAATGLFSDVSQKASVNDDKTGQRIDFINERTGNWSFYYHFDDSTLTNPLNGSVPGFASVTPSRAQMFTLSNTKTLGASGVNELRLSFFRTSIFTNVPTSSFTKLSSLGFTTGAGTLGILPSGPPGYPEFLPKMTFNSFNLGVNVLSTYQPNNTYMISDGLSKVVGQHSLKMGGEFRYLQLNARNVCYPNGSFVFDGSESGSDFADFLLGAPASYTQCSVQVLDSRTRYGATYFQDSWKVKPNLTLNLGLRWEVSMPWYDTQGKLNTWVKGVQSTQFPTAPAGFVVPGDPGIPSTIYHTQFNRFAPRVGFAYSPDFNDGFLGKLFGGPGKTSIRGAFGIYYFSQPDLANFGIFGDAPFGQFYTSATPPSLDTPFQVRSDGSSAGQRFPFVIPIPGSPANQNLNFGVYLPLIGPGYAPDNVLPYAEHYNFTIQRALSSATVLTLSYVGTQAHHLMVENTVNPGSAAVCFALVAARATPTCGPNGENRAYTLPNGSRVQGTTTNYPYPFFSSRMQYYTTMGNSNYNSFQATVERKAADMTFLTAYTYSKAIDMGTGDGEYLNPFNYRLSRGLSAFDMTHNFVGSYHWAIPFDRWFHGGPRRLTQGWSISGITRFTTGLPITLSQSAGDLSLVGRANIDMPNAVAPVVIQDARNAGPTGRPNIYFLASSFSSEVLGTIGNANRRSFHGPGLINTDFGLSKSIQVTESTSFQIRAEFFNIFNHTQFNNPSGNFSNSTFGQVTSARPPRIGQLSAKFVW
jgi:hypothetical protein